MLAPVPVVHLRSGRGLRPGTGRFVQPELSIGLLATPRCAAQVAATAGAGPAPSAASPRGQLLRAAAAAASGAGLCGLSVGRRCPGAAAGALRGWRRAGGRWARGASAGGAAAVSGPRVVFVIGGPGSGKGTQCERIAKDLGYVHLSAGELLRAERKVPGSPLGEVIERAITSGGVVPSEVIAGLLEQAMRKAGWTEARFVVDGYPRSEEQLRGWEATLSSKVRLLFCLSLEVGREEMRRRLLGRAETSGRSDDNEATIEKRFVTFQEETGPLLQHFGSLGLLRKVDGGRRVEEVWEEVRELFEETHAADAAGAAAKAG